MRLQDSTGDKVEVQADAVLLALGGASWSKLGSDGKWVETLSAAGVPVSELRPNNVGFQVHQVRCGFQTTNGSRFLSLSAFEMTIDET